jgi:hypothetical protein
MFPGKAVVMERLLGLNQATQHWDAGTAPRAALYQSCVVRLCLMSDKRGSTMEAEFRALLCCLLTGRAGYCFRHLSGGRIIPG